MRVAFFLNDFPSLSQTFILNQITGLIDLGAEVEIFAFNKNKIDTIHEIVYKYDLLSKVIYIHALPPKRTSRLMMLSKMLRPAAVVKNILPLIKALKISKYRGTAGLLQLPADIIQIKGNKSFDIIHCQFGTVANRALNLIEAGALSGKLVTSFRGYDATRYPMENPGVYDRLFVKGEHFMPVSKSLSETIRTLGCPENKITVVHSGIVLNNFQFSSNKYPESGPIKIITVARLVEKKGLEYSIKAVAKAISAGKDLRYSIVGDGVQLAQLELLVEQLGIKSNVAFLGWKTHAEVISLFSESHILLAPSITAENGDQEGIPNVMKEAMAMGLPVIGTIHGGIPELVEHEKTGFLVAEKDSDAMATSLINLCNKPEIWSNLCLRARHHIEKEFDSLRLNEKLMDLYKSLS